MKYVVVVRETTEQVFEVEAENADVARAHVEDLGFGHDGCVDWQDFLAAEDTDLIEFVDEFEIARTVRRPRRLNP